MSSWIILLLRIFVLWICLVCVCGCMCMMLMMNLYNRINMPCNVKSDKENSTESRRTIPFVRLTWSCQATGCWRVLTLVLTFVTTAPHSPPPWKIFRDWKKKMPYVGVTSLSWVCLFLPLLLWKSSPSALIFPHVCPALSFSIHWPLHYLCSKTPTCPVHWTSNGLATKWPGPKGQLIVLLGCWEPGLQAPQLLSGSWPSEATLHSCCVVNRVVFPVACCPALLPWPVELATGPTCCAPPRIYNSLP